MYTEQQVCQMHYFRFMRKGHYELEPRTYRIINEAGYHSVWNPSHPLAQQGGYVFEHRAVLFAAIGPAPMQCALCQTALTWKTCKVDHIDEVVSNNERSNLRPTCNFCNSRRGIRPPIEWDWTHKLTHSGERRTARDWARDPRVRVAYATIIRRKKRGASDEEALFAPRKTHNSGDAI